MPKVSAGLLLFRRGAGGIEVLLGHMGGPFWAGKEAGAWTIPKGLPAPGEDLLVAARREVREETGLAPEGPFLPLPPVRQAGGKEVHAWAVETDRDPTMLRSNTFRVEWPPRSGQWRSYPEIDRTAWFTLPEARARIVRGQIAIIDELETIVGKSRREESRSLHDRHGAAR
jgi:predicted NUDIX family NTP pyrophosphohydrolase